MGLENLKLDDDSSQEIAKKMQEVKLLNEGICIEEADVAKNAITSLDTNKLASFIESQFKTGENRKPYNEIVSNSMYTFIVQASLDLLGYDSLLVGEDQKYGVDGIYASRTKTAVKKFQEDAGLTGSDVDGLVGKKTFILLVNKLKSVSTPVVENTTNDPKFGPIATATDDASLPTVEKSKDKPIYTSLNQIIDNPAKTLVGYKSDVKVRLNGVERGLGSAVYNMFGNNGSTLIESGALKNYNQIKNSIIGDPLLNAYILYRSMKGLGTYENVVNNVIMDNKSILHDVVKVFGVVEGDDFIDYLVSDFGGIADDAVDRIKLQKYLVALWDSDAEVRKIILAKNYLRNGYSQLASHMSKYPNGNLA